MSSTCPPPAPPPVPPRRLRLRMLGAAGAAGLAVTLARSAPPANDIGDLAAALGTASRRAVSAHEVRWEPSGGVFGDAIYGRWVLFLGSESPGAPRDLYRARVRLAPEGRPLEVMDVHNLTQTALGDDHALVVSGTHAAFATFAFGQEQSVTALDLSGEGAENTTEKAADRAMAWVTNLQQTGTREGIGRVDVTLDQPAKRLGLAVSDRALDVDLADSDGQGVTRRARLDLARGELTDPALGADPPGMHAQPGRHLPKRFIFWAVDTVRAVPWIGPAPIAWLEEKVFAAKDSAKQLAFKIHGAGEASVLAQKEEAPPQILDSSQTGDDVGHWPLPNMRSPWKTPEPDEGVWEAPKMAWLKKFPALRDGDAAPPAFLRAFVRPDEERPYTKVLLLAMDMRQLDLDMEAGVEDPKPMAGPPGLGRIPRDPAVFKRVAAAFNGGFKTEHGNYGMMVRRRTLLPPQLGAATVVITKDARVGMGSWGVVSPDGFGIQDVPDTEIVSYRQNLDPLVDNDKVNPNGRGLWGWTLPGTSMQTERSGLCVTAAGHLVYAWGDDVSAPALGKAMRMAGCVYGMHLDMNPHHTGFIFANITELKGRNYKSELLSTKMEVSPDRYIEYAPKDFFYVLIHDPTPPPIEGATDRPWRPDPGAQPAPTWLAGVWSTNVEGAELLEVEPARATWRVRAGTNEPDAKTGSAPLHDLAEDDAHRVLFAVGMGTTHEKRPMGLSTDGRVVFPMSRAEGRGVLVAKPDGSLAIRVGDEPDQASARADEAELPLLLDAGAPVQAGHAGASHAALGTTPAGRVFIARAPQGTAASLADVLKRAGCTRAVLLDRGARAGALLHRAGTETPPRARYEETVLYAIANPLVPRGFRFEPQTPYVPPKR